MHHPVKISCWIQGWHVQGLRHIACVDLKDQDCCMPFSIEKVTSSNKFQKTSHEMMLALAAQAAANEQAILNMQCLHTSSL